ncbi:MAG: serine/threonine protein kinase [Bryobacterales bacterium]|nr:serine/threonine protein kinase [Bryobacterales bacterium]
MESGTTWDRVERAFEEALRLPAAEREDWVRGSCATDPKVRDEVLQLLRARQNQGEFLQAPMLDFTGQSFGPYTAVEEIGRGGMSIVYRGRRTEGDFEKQVAIKVVLLQSSQDVRKSETQILAGLEHPQIARLLDAGRTALGFRYLLMEHVQGRPITEYCTALNERDRLKLFLDVCEAVQYAHRSLVVHRDLKPENILVTAAGEVKLLDFGIAKILDPEAGAEQTHGVRAFSPNYASPEQLLGQPVTTSTDIYSLGVLLCELLGGQPPRRLDGLTLEQVVDEARRAVRDIPLRGDLAAIARKALDAEPANRYESAGAFARDVERYLGGLPIEAREPTWTYRTGKFISRHRYSVAAATLAALSLVAALAYALWQASRAEFRFNQVRELARAVMFDLHDEVRDLPGSLSARKAIVDRSITYLDTLATDTSASADVQLDLARGYLRLADLEGKDYGGASLGRSQDALEHALRAVEIARRVVASHPRDRVARQTLVDALDYATAAYNLRADSAQALPLGQEAVRLAETLVNERPDSAEDLERLAVVTKQLADAHSKSPAREKGIPFFSRNLELRQKLHDANPGDPSRQQRLAESHQWLASELWWSKDYGRSEIHARESLRLNELRYLKDPRAARSSVAADALLMAMLALRGKRHQEAVAYLNRTLHLRREISAEDPKNAVAVLRVAAALNRLGLAYREWGRYPEAIRYGREALTIARRVYEADRKHFGASREIVYSLADLAITYQAAGEMPNACQLARETVTLSKQIPVSPQVKPSFDKMSALAEACAPQPR